MPIILGQQRHTCLPRRALKAQEQQTATRLARPGIRVGKCHCETVSSKAASPLIGKEKLQTGLVLISFMLYLSDFVVCTSNSFLGSSTRKQRCLCPRSLTQFAFGQFLTPTSGLQLSLIVWQPALVPAGFISD